MAERWLEKSYKGLDGKTREGPGSVANFALDIAPGTPNAAKPAIKWTVTRSPGADDLYAPDPELTETIQDTTDFFMSRRHRHVLEVKLPGVSGATYDVSVKVGAAKVKALGGFTTWHRIYLDIEADDATVLKIFRDALPTLVAAYKRASILFIENTVKVGAAAVAAKDKSEGGVRGRRILLKLQPQ